MTTIVIVAFVSLLLGYVAGRYRLYALQNDGEALVSRTLAAAFAAPNYLLMNNLTLPVDDGTTQVDHVLVSRFGIFVIETKDYKGWIFANPQSPVWTQVVFKQKYKFQNPIFQNYKHLRSVQALLDFLPPETVRSAVVFTGKSDFQTPRPDGVFTVDGLVSFIADFSEEAMSENRMQFCVGRLECQRMALTRETDVEHRTNLQRRFGER